MNKSTTKRKRQNKWENKTQWNELFSLQLFCWDSFSVRSRMRILLNLKLIRPYGISWGSFSFLHRPASTAHSLFVYRECVYTWNMGKYIFWVLITGNLNILLASLQNLFWQWQWEWRDEEREISLEKALNYLLLCSANTNTNACANASRCLLSRSRSY
jgi:hypothetical protein